MSTGWTAPGSTEEPAGPGPGSGQASGSASGPAGGPATGPQRELVQQVPLFPLRPLSLGEVLGAAVRIYRMRPKAVLGLAAAVYGVAFVLITLATGAGMIPLIGQMQATLEDPGGEAFETSVGGTASDILATLGSSVVTMVVTLVASSLVTVVLTRISLGEATGHRVPDGGTWPLLRRLALPAVGLSLLVGVLSVLAFLIPVTVGALPLLIIQEAGSCCSPWRCGCWWPPRWTAPCTLP